MFWWRQCLGQSSLSRRHPIKNVHNCTAIISQIIMGLVYLNVAAFYTIRKRNWNRFWKPKSFCLYIYMIRVNEQSKKPPVQIEMPAEWKHGRYSFPLETPKIPRCVQLKIQWRLILLTSYCFIYFFIAAFFSKIVPCVGFRVRQQIKLLDWR